MTRRVNATCTIGGMNNNPTFHDLLPPNECATLETCESVILCLSSRRFVVVRDEDPRDLWPINGGWPKIRQLQPGDEVIYKGQLSTVRAIDVYQ